MDGCKAGLQLALALAAAVPFRAQSGGVPSGVKASLFFGVKASNYYRESGNQDNFFGQRGFLLLETRRENLWSTPWKEGGGLFGAFLLEGKNQTVYNPQGSNGVLDYSKKVLKETGNYSAEVGLRQGLWGSPSNHVSLGVSWVFRNVSQRLEERADSSLDFSDRSRASFKASFRISTEKPGSDFGGSFVELGYLNDAYYVQARKRLLLRGRLGAKAFGSETVKFFFEGYINRGIGTQDIQEKDESVVMVGLHIPFGAD